MIFVPASELENFMIDVFSHLGTTPQDAKICANVLITSDLRGIESHGIGRLRMYVDRINQGLIDPTSQPQVVKDSKTTSVIDGCHGIGMVIAYRSMNMAIKKAKEFGMGAVAVRNSTHFGIDGYYPLMAVREGMIGVSFTNARPSVAPTFSSQPVLGTNPIAFGAPTDEDFPFLFDAATSIIQRGKIEVLNREGGRVEDGFIINSNGKFLNDPEEILNKLVNDEATLLPLGGDGDNFGGHKGYGLATMVEILSSSLQSGAFLFALSGLDRGQDNRYRVGHFFMAIKIEDFLPLDEFKKNIGDLLRGLRSAKKYPGHDRIYTSGEKEYVKENEIKKSGVAINSKLNQDILYIKELLKINSLPMIG